MIGSRTNGIRQVRSVLAPTVHVGSRLHRGDHRFLAGLDVVAASPRRLSTEQNKLAKSDQSRQWGRVTQVKAVGVMPQVKAVGPGDEAAPTARGTARAHSLAWVVDLGRLGELGAAVVFCRHVPNRAARVTSPP